MASSLALKKFVSLSVIPSSIRLLRPAAAAYPSTSRLFNTNTMGEYYDDAEERHVDVDRHSGRSVPSRRDDFISDVFDPFSSTRSLSQVLNLLDQFIYDPFVSDWRGVGAGFCRGWDTKENEDAIHLRIDMPGLGKEDVKVCMEQNTLVIKGEGPKESEDEESGRRYTSRIVLPEKIYKVDEIKAGIKNGVLRVVVPKVKEEERKGVFYVQVE